MTTVLVASARDHERSGIRLREVAAGEFEGDLRAALEADDPDVTIEVRHTDDEAELISWLREAVENEWGVVFDPTGFAQYSYALRDAAAFVTDAGLPLIEVHVGSPTPSVVSAVSTGLISGLGLDSYRFAVRAAADRVASAASRISA